MAVRPEDNPGIKIDRVIPLWGVISTVVPIVMLIIGQAILLWNGQQLHAQRMDYMGNQFAEQAALLKGMAAQLNAKDSKDVLQEAQLADHERRLLKLETTR